MPEKKPDSNLALTKPAKGGTRNQLDREKKELLDLIRAAPDVPDDYHPLVEMARLANSQNIPVNLRMKAHSEVAQYVTPKLRQVDPKGGQKKKVPKLKLTLLRE